MSIVSTRSRARLSLAAVSLASPAAAAPAHDGGSPDVWGCVQGSTLSAPHQMVFVVDTATTQKVDPASIRVAVAPDASSDEETTVPHAFEFVAGTVAVEDLRAAAAGAWAPEIRVYVGDRLEASLPLDPATGTLPSTEWTPAQESGCERVETATGPLAPGVSFSPLRQGEETLVWNGSATDPETWPVPASGETTIVDIQGAAQGTVTDTPLDADDAARDWLPNARWYTAERDAHGLDVVYVTYTDAEGRTQRHIDLWDILSDAEIIEQGGVPVVDETPVDDDHTVPGTVETGDGAAWLLAAAGALGAGALVTGRRRLGLQG